MSFLSFFLAKKNKFQISVWKRKEKKLLKEDCFNVIAIILITFIGNAMLNVWRRKDI